MPRPISFYRWYRGKVWHVGFSDDAAAACGKERPADAETVGERAPVNARVCGDCVAMALHLYALAQAGQLGDPRTPERGLIGVPGAPLPEVDQCICGHPPGDHDGGWCEWPECACSSGSPSRVLSVVGDDGVVDAEIYCGSCDHVEHIGPCTLVEGNRITEPCDCYVTDEWPCGACGHPNLDHDCDDETCTVTNDDPRVEWAECPCRGLKRAG